VLGSDGKPFGTFTSGYAMGGEGFRCGDNTYIKMTIQYGAPPDGWTAGETTYRWENNALVKVSDEAAAADHANRWAKLRAVRCTGRVRPDHRRALSGNGQDVSVTSKIFTPDFSDNRHSFSRPIENPSASISTIAARDNQAAARTMAHCVTPTRSVSGSLRDSLAMHSGCMRVFGLYEHQSEVS